jgi:hypothetical protein
MGVLPGQPSGVRHREYGVEEVDVGARAHRLPNVAVAGGEDVTDDAPLLIAQALVGHDELAEFIAADLVAGRRRVGAQ